jgi:hypothetical protein
MDRHFLTLINWGVPLCTIKRLKLKVDKLLSNLAFKFNLRRYTKGRGSGGANAWKDEPDTDTEDKTPVIFSTLCRAYPPLVPFWYLQLNSSCSVPGDHATNPMSHLEAAPVEVEWALAHLHLNSSCFVPGHHATYPLHTLKLLK